MFQPFLGKCSKTNTRNHIPVFGLTSDKQFNTLITATCKMCGTYKEEKVEEDLSDDKMIQKALSLIYKKI